ncbi:uncharacterized protein BX664DRAFT_381362 [Halteromyces radiatus]|uniref:uncharacterized protein n=1 Tax=Halteromyces radiatus TaxID=101107 RepID=UPI002220DD90|nr:uncharacterized protein BX664DRAFT_381362 [Halteromyces radiatus]KAI8098679.1 hypothetical protein BX664DRAFT_381362 [Halteromyces radiatus]
MYRSLTRLQRSSNVTLSKIVRQPSYHMKLVPRYSTTSTSTTTKPTGSNYANEFIRVSHPTTTLSVYNDRLTAALRKRSHQQGLEQVQAIVQEMKDQNIKFDALTYNSLLLAYTRAKQQDTAMDTLNEMTEKGFKPTVESYNIVLQSLANKTNASKQNKVIAMMEEQQVPLTAISYQHLIQGMLSRNNLDLIMGTLETMKERDIEPTLLSYNYAIGCCLYVNGPDTAFSLMKEAEEKNLALETEPRLLMDVLRVNALNDKLEETQYCWNKVVLEHGIRPDEGTCLQVLRVAANSGESKLATEVIRQLSNNGYPYKEHYFIPLMEAFVVKDDLKSAFNVLDIMRVSGVIPTMRSTLAISNKISRDVESVDKAYYLLEEMKKEGKTVDVTAFNIVIAACGLAKDIGRTVATYREASNLGVVPDVDTFNAVLEACIQTEMKGMGQIVIEELKKAKVTPNVETFSKMITLACTQPNYEDAFVYLEEMKSHGIIPPRQCYVVLAKKLAWERDPRYHIALEEMETYGYRPGTYVKSLWK